MITNYMSPLEFRVAIKRLPSVEFFIQRAAIPGISSTAAEQPTPFNKTFHTSDELMFNNLDLTFIIDEQMTNFMEIFNWIQAATFPRHFGEFKDLVESPEGLSSDISIQILNSHKRPSIELQFVNCFPISLTDVILDTTQTDIVYPEVTATFQYDTYSIRTY